MKSKHSIEIRDLYLYIKIVGECDFSDFISYMKIALDECEKENRYKIIVDALEVEHANISTMDRFKLGEEVVRLRGNKIKIAMVWPEKYINRFTSTVVVNRGGFMEIFGNIDDAKK